jgi:ParB-like chromosome segregation protein Spo0J
VHPTHVIVPISRIKADPKNGQIQSRRQINKIAGSIREFGFAEPVLLDGHDVLIGEPT